MNRREQALRLIADPVRLGWALGYKDLRRDLHGEWIREMVCGQEDETLQGHRGSYKSTCLGLGIALLMALKRDKNIIFLRKTDGDVVEVVKSVQRILQSEIFQALYWELAGAPLTLLRASSTEITTSAYCAARGASQLLGIGLGGSLTGKHADYIFTDDIVNRLDRTSQAERERTKAIYMELQNIRNPGGRIFNTGTPWHKEDAFSIMPPPRRYDCYQTGLLTGEQIQRLRESMSPSLFAANYELRHIAEENALFPEAPRFIDDPQALLLRDGIAHIDAAYGGEDYTALTCAKRHGDTIYLYGRLWHSHVDTVLEAALTECERRMCAPVYVETNGDKGYLGREIRKRGTPVRAYPEKMNKYLKISTYLRKWWKNIVFVQGTDPAYIAQIQDYTEDAAHDDAADSAACCCRILDRRE